MSMAAQNRIKELIYILNEACRTYYYSGQPTLTDKEFDNKLKELEALEKETGIIFDCSPTQNVGSAPIEGNDIYTHAYPVLSLNSTKSIDEVRKFVSDQEVVISWKLDGVSVVLYYEKGVLKKALSRGDGKRGKDITKNVMLLKNVPLKLSEKVDIIVRGEGCISLNQFDILKQTKAGEKYINPRNMASGLINGTKNTSYLLKNLTFVAHSIVYVSHKFLDAVTRLEQLLYLKSFGFEVVEHSIVNRTDAEEFIEYLTSMVADYPYPVDGLVLSMNDVLFSESMGSTARFPKHSLAYKWPDESVETTVTGMKWSVSQTGLITPIVQFEPVFLEGSTVKQANLYNLKIFNSLGIGIGDTIKIYKANKIIPHVEENFTRSETESYPTRCPICWSPTSIEKTEDTIKLYCRSCGGK